MALMTKLKEMVPKELPWRRKPVEAHDVLSLREDINELFDRFLFSPFDFSWSALASGRGIDVEETKDGVIVRAEVPGLDPKYLNVEVRNGVIDIRYERDQEWQRNGSGSGRRYAAFHRTIPVPDGVETAQAQAVCKHGLLVIRIPWSQAAKDSSRRIHVAIE